MTRNVRKLCDEDTIPSSCFYIQQLWFCCCSCYCFDRGINANHLPQMSPVTCSRGRSPETAQRRSRGRNTLLAEATGTAQLTRRAEQLHHFAFSAKRHRIGCKSTFSCLHISTTFHNTHTHSVHNNPNLQNIREAIILPLLNCLPTPCHYNTNNGLLTLHPPTLSSHPESYLLVHRNSHIVTQHPLQNTHHGNITSSQNKSLPPHNPRNHPPHRLPPYPHNRLPFRAPRPRRPRRSLQRRNAIALREHSTLLFRKENQHLQCVLRQAGLGLGDIQLLPVPVLAPFGWKAMDPGRKRQTHARHHSPRTRFHMVVLHHTMVLWPCYHRPRIYPDRGPMRVG